jgi:uncharacterized CHY-type Zn-finger protein
MLIKGKPIDAQTRCVHYHSELDVIAIKFKCCGDYYPCYECHAETAGHDAQRWPKTEFSLKAILCGRCGAEHAISVYLASEHQCPGCGGAFNPRCALHKHLYFEQ